MNSKHREAQASTARVLLTTFSTNQEFSQPIIHYWIVLGDRDVCSKDSAKTKMIGKLQ